MQSPSGKATQYLLAAAKLLIVALAFWFIWQRLAGAGDAERALFFERLTHNFDVVSIVSLLALAFLNRFFEILKWQTLLTSLRPITVAESSKQVLAALTMSVFTPNGIGEYGAKALFFPKSQAKRIVFLNLICNGVQLLVTVVLGLIGLALINLYYDVAEIRIIAIAVGILMLIFAALYLGRGITVKGYSLRTLGGKVRELPDGIHKRNAALAVLRYLAFSHQYYLMFVVLGADIGYVPLMALIAGMYFIASALPTMQLFDFAVKGGVAVYFFGLAGINEWIPAFVATAMWLLNVALPVLIGSYFVISFKPAWKQSSSS